MKWVKLRPSCCLASIIGLLFLLTLSCATKVAQWDYRLGLLKDAKTGFYALKTQLPPSQVMSVFMVAASLDSLTHRETLWIPQKEVVYPSAVFPEQAVLRPAEVESILEENDLIGDVPENKRKVVLGYFWCPLGGGDAFSGGSVLLKDSDTPFKIEGLRWGEVRKIKPEIISKKLASMRKIAAEYGGHAIVDVSLRDIREKWAYGGRDVYIFGRVVVFDEGSI